MNVLQAGASRFSPFFLFGSLVFLILHGDLPIDLRRGLTGDATFLIGGGSDAIAVGRLGRDQPALLEQTGEDTLQATFDQPQRAATPGQALVAYDGDTVIGGGVIA